MLHSRTITSLIKLQESHCFVCIKFLKINNIEKLAFAAFTHLTVPKGQEFPISGQLSLMKAGDKCGTSMPSFPQGPGPLHSHPLTPGLAGPTSPFAPIRERGTGPESQCQLQLSLWGLLVSQTASVTQSSRGTEEFVCNPLA